jgi:hypothetical protein
MPIVDTARLAVGAIAILAVGPQGCGGADTGSGDAPAESRPAFSLPAEPPTGPPAGLVRGVAEGVNVTVSPGGAHIAFSDVTTEATRSQLDGQEISLHCTTAAGDEIASAPRQWPRGESALTLMLSPRGEPVECSVNAGGAAVLTASMAPVGAR